MKIISREWASGLRLRASGRAGKLPPESREAEISAHLDALAERLAAGATVFVHCSAGLHRTGMIAAALLFRAGLDAGSVPEALRRMRPVTTERVGSERLEWAAWFARTCEE